MAGIMIMMSGSAAGATGPAVNGKTWKALKTRAALAWLWASVWMLGASVPALCLAAPDALRVNVPSLDSVGGQPVQLPAAWMPVAAPASTTPAPAMLLLHGCGGMRDRKGVMDTRFADMAARLHAMGIHVLVTDSFTPRGERELCTQRTGSRKVTQLNRRRDALGALAWLEAQPGVDKARIGLIGWSNGGSTVLAATNLAHGEVARAPVRPSLAVAFYPGCDADQRRGYKPVAALLMLLGEADDWTPVAPCKALAAAAADAEAAPTLPPVAGAASAPSAAATAASSVPPPQWEAYEGAYHGFDGALPVRLRRDVPNGIRPGQGVHVGANAQARAAAHARLELFLHQTWGLRP